MKLYTEEQILFYLTMHSSAITRYDLHNIPHIELPSDEEIHNEAFKQTRYSDSFIRGAKWMRDKIQEDNNAGL